MHTTEIRSLIDLQARDKVIDDLARKIAAVPLEIGALNDAFEEKKGVMYTAKDALIKLQVEKKAKELIIAEKEEEIKKHQRELNMVKDNTVFKALLTEIERANKDQDEIETAILGLMDLVDKAAAEDKRLQQEMKKLEEEKNSRTKELEASRINMGTALEAAKAERADFAGKIGAEVIEKYEFIRAQRKGLAIAHIKEDKSGHISCGGCNMGLTAQKIVDIKTPHALAFCDNCQRMIYMDKTVNTNSADGILKD
jgi:hypothetical protein